MTQIIFFTVYYRHAYDSQSGIVKFSSNEFGLNIYRQKIGMFDLTTMNTHVD